MMLSATSPIPRARRYIGIALGDRGTTLWPVEGSTYRLINAILRIKTVLVIEPRLRRPQMSGK